MTYHGPYLSEISKNGLTQRFPGQAIIRHYSTWLKRKCRIIRFLTNVNIHWCIWPWKYEWKYALICPPLGRGEGVFGRNIHWLIFDSSQHDGLTTKICDDHFSHPNEKRLIFFSLTCRQTMTYIVITYFKGLSTVKQM